MNVTSLFRNHPEFAELVLGPPVHLVKCADCLYHFPPDQLYPGGDALLCATCFDHRQDAAWAEWHDRLAKEGNNNVCL